MSTEYRECRVCHTQRDRSTLVHGVCPFCSDATNVVEEPQKKARQKRSTRVKPAETPPPNPSESPTAPADPSVGTYAAPAFDLASAEAHPQAELAARELARRRLLHFIKRFRPKYLAGWVHEDICRRLERFLVAVERGESPRLLLMCPPRSGKSEIGSRHFPAWVLGKHPDWEIIAASHTASLTLSFSRYIRDILRDPAYKVLFPDTHLDPASQSTENWNLLNGGGYLAAGVGTGITGRGCFIGSTLIHSDEGLIEIKDLVQSLRSGNAHRVLAYDHVACRPEYKNVIATHEERTKELIEITFDEGRRVRCTPNHTVFVEGRGYIAADLLGCGDTILFAENMSAMRSFEVPGVQGVQAVLREDPPQRARPGVFELRGEVQAPEVRGRKVCEAWSQGPLLLKGLQRGTSRGEKRQNLRTVLGANAGGAQQRILLTRVQGCSEAEKTDNVLPGVQHHLHSAQRHAEVLFKALFGHGSRAGDARSEQPQLQGWLRLPGHLLQNARAYFEAGQKRLRGLWQQALAAGASHRRGEDKRRAGESGYSLSDLPRNAPQIRSGTVALVERVRCEPVSVYDLQVEDHSNYFANSLLVHNCHILLLDDLVKDENEATSATITDGTWSWYSSTAYTRLAPGGGVLGIMTWWSEADWAGRIQAVMASGEGDKFEIVRYPAINEEGDEYLLADDTIVEIIPGDTVPEGARLTRPKGTAIHPERYSTQAMQRIKSNLFAAGEHWVWNALYQQNPVPDDGTFFTKDMFRYYGTAPARDEMYVYQAWDFAITEGQGKDYTVGACLGQDHRGNLYLLDLVRFQSGDSFVIVDEIMNFARKWRVDLLGFEDGQIWKAMSAVFEKACEDARYYPATELLKPLTDKKVRATPLRGLMQHGKVYFDDKADWFQPLRREFTRFLSGGKNDDIVDSVSWAARLTLTRSAPKQKDTQPKTKSWKDKLSLYTGQTGGSHMSA